MELAIIFFPCTSIFKKHRMIWRRDAFMHMWTRRGIDMQSMGEGGGVEKVLIGRKRRRNSILVTVVPYTVISSLVKSGLEHL